MNHMRFTYAMKPHLKMRPLHPARVPSRSIPGSKPIVLTICFYICSPSLFVFCVLFQEKSPVETLLCISHRYGSLSPHSPISLIPPLPSVSPLCFSVSIISQHLPSSHPPNPLISLLPLFKLSNIENMVWPLGVVGIKISRQRIKNLLSLSLSQTLQSPYIDLPFVFPVLRFINLFIYLNGCFELYMMPHFHFLISALHLTIISFNWTGGKSKPPQTPSMLGWTSYLAFIYLFIFMTKLYFMLVIECAWI